MGQLIRNIASGLDDVFTESGTVSQPLRPSYAYIRCGYHSALSAKYCPGLRFINIDTPPLATIDSAELTVYVSDYTGTINFNLYGDDVNNAPPWAEGDQPYQITKTIANKFLTISNAGSKTWDVIDIVQEIIDRPGWNVGNALRLAGFPSGTPAGVNTFDFRSYEYGSSFAQLTINYTLPSGDNDIPLIIKGIDDIQVSGTLYSLGFELSAISGHLFIPAYNIAQTSGNLFINGHEFCDKRNYTIKAWGSNDVGQCNVPAPNIDFDQVNAGWTFGVGLKTNGSVIAWGDNSYGQLNVPPSNSDFVTVSAGAYHVAGLKSDGSIVCWGSNFQNQCDVPDPNQDFIAVAAGDFFTLGLKSNGIILAWGTNLYGQLDVPEPNNDFISVSAGGDFGLGLKSSGVVVVWGDNTYGQSGVPAPNNDYTAIDGGGFHALALRPSGIIVGWGANNFLQTSNIPSPNIDFIKINDGSRHCLAIKDNESIAAWGSNSHGELDTPYPNTRYIDVSAGKWFSLGIQRALGNDLYICGCKSVDNFSNLFIHGCDSVETSNDLFISGPQQTINSSILFIRGHIENIVSGILYVDGCEPCGISGHLFAEGCIKIENSDDLFIYGHQNYMTSGDLFIHGHNILPTSGNLFVHGDEYVTISCDLFLYGYEDVIISGDLFTEGRIDTSGVSAPSLFICGYDVISASGDSFICGHDATGGGAVNLYINGYELIMLSGDLFTCGSGIISENGRSNFFVNGYEPKPALACPVLDQTASIQIKDSLIRIYQSRIDALINQLGKNVYLEFDPIREPCPNCYFDVIRKRSTGIYKPGGPRPFVRGRKCSYCKGHGFKETAVNKCIKCLIKWNPKDAENFGIAISQTKGIVRLKTYLTEADDLMRAKTVIVNHDIVNQMKLRVRLIQGPIPVGLREDRYCISFWELL